MSIGSLNKSQWNTMIVGSLAYFADAWDAFLLIYVLSDMAKDFGISIGTVSIALLFTYLSRWLGGIIFGSISAKWGRKKSLMIAVFILGVFTVLTGTAPSFGALLFIRLCFGIGMGGVYAAAAPLVIESVPASLRGFASGFFMFGFYIGNIIAPWTYVWLAPQFGWRGVFFFGGISLLLIPYILLTVKESPVWLARKEELKSKGGVAEKSLPFWKIFAPGYIGITLILMMVSFGQFFEAYPVQSLMPTFLKTVRHFPVNSVAFAGTMMGIGSLIGALFGGWISDKIGRKRTIKFGLILALIPVSFMLLSTEPTVIIIASTIDGFIFGSISGLIAAFLNEHYPTDLRGTGSGFIQNLGSLGGSVGAVVAANLNQSVGWSWTIILIVLFGGILGLVGIFFAKETRNVSLGGGMHVGNSASSTQRKLMS
ncbi:MFS transporter [Fictibacillus enclensis]|uniref:MFS transporter n=1 Tax=Fictibacillus enclensis TaxID=1017270 RepID=UPI0025A12336|nr:MFS transporter [Fictibacillus enclensis]MDM5199002.1 MFS transporter [Fictibacillus enclensis]